MKRPVAVSLTGCPVFKIAANDTNKFIVLMDSLEVPLPFVLVVEIFDAFGQTPPNVHKEAFEIFYVLSGSGTALVGDESMELSRGSCLTVPPGTSHQITNTEAQRLYVLTTMIPDEAFSSLIRRGVPAQLDDEDRAVLLGV